MKLHIFPTWVWLIFIILFVSLILIIFKRRHWRTTLAFAGLAITVILFAAGFDAWHAFLGNHFVGQYDTLGIPFRKAGPGWSILLEAWPLWVVPTLFAGVLALAIDWIVRHFQTSKAESITLIKEETFFSPSTPLQKNVKYQLEVDALKQELTQSQEKLDKVIQKIEEQVDKNQELEIQLAELEEASQKEILMLRDKIKSLQSEVDQPK